MLARKRQGISEASRRPRTGIALLGSLLAASLVLTACTSGAPAAPPGAPATKAPAAATPAPVATKASAPATTPAAAGGTTASTLADSGKTVFAGSCAGCHGDQGQGANAPALIGSKAQLAKYSTGKGLYDFVKATMPRNRPGSLSADQYLQVTAFLLVQNNDVQPSAALNESTLSNVKLP